MMQIGKINPQTQPNSGPSLVHCKVLRECHLCVRWLSCLACRDGIFLTEQLPTCCHATHKVGSGHPGHEIISASVQRSGHARGAFQISPLPGTAAMFGELGTEKAQLSRWGILRAGLPSEKPSGLKSSRGSCSPSRDHAHLWCGCTLLAKLT